MTGFQLAGTAITDTVASEMGPASVTKQADQSIASSTVFTNDSELTISLGGTTSSQYFFFANIDYEGGVQGASDIKWQWAVPAGATMRYGASLNSTAGAATIISGAATSAGFAAGTNGAGNRRPITFAGTLTLSGATGSMTFQWAQNSSSATATIVHSGSFVTVWRNL